MRVVIRTDVTSTKGCENRHQKGECERKDPHAPCAKPIAQPIFDAGHRLATGSQTDGSDIKRQCGCARASALSFEPGMHSLSALEWWRLDNLVSVFDSRVREMIITRSPLRISLGGGGTDLPSYYRDHGGFLIAAAIDKYVYITVHRRFVDGFY